MWGVWGFLIILFAFKTAIHAAKDPNFANFVETTIKISLLAAILFVFGIMAIKIGLWLDSLKQQRQSFFPTQMPTFGGNIVEQGVTVYQISHVNNTQVFEQHTKVVSNLPQISRTCNR